MNVRRSIVPMLLAALLAGCSSDGEKTQFVPATLDNFKPTAKFDMHWKRHVGQMGLNVLLPAVSKGSVFAANGKGEIYRFDRTSGNPVWQISNEFAISGGIGAGDDQVFAGSEKGVVAAYEESTGHLRWQNKVSSEVLSAPSYSDGVVVVRSGDGRITGLDSRNGNQLWVYERMTPALVARSNVGVTIHKGIVYAGFAAGKLAAINLHNGIIVWESTVSQPRGNTELERVSDVISLPIVDDSQVCAVAFQGRLACFDADQGSSLWTRDISSDKGLTISRKYLFISDFNGVIFALDKISGSSYWKNDKLFLRKTTAPLPLGKYLVVADFEGYLHALNRDDGSFVARFVTDGSAIPSAPIEDEDGFIVQTSDGGVYALSIH